MMTDILKELKDLDQKATSAPWNCREVMGHVHVRDGNQDTVVGFATYGGECKYLHNARMMTATRNALPALIRVIELADDALSSIDDDNVSLTDGVEKIKNALSEIRKMKGLR